MSQVKRRSGRAASAAGLGEREYVPLQTACRAHNLTLTAVEAGATPRPMTE